MLHDPCGLTHFIGIEALLRDMAQNMSHYSLRTKRGALLKAAAEIDKLRSEVSTSMAAEREACAKSLDLKASDLRLMAGEMNAGELRTVMAVLDWLKVRMRGADGCTRLPPIITPPQPPQ